MCFIFGICYGLYKKNRGKEIECKILLVYNLFFVCFVMREKFFFIFFFYVWFYIGFIK